jgi:hypothetical protein
MILRMWFLPVGYVSVAPARNARKRWWGIKDRRLWRITPAVDLPRCLLQFRAIGTPRVTARISAFFIARWQSMPTAMVAIDLLDMAVLRLTLTPIQHYSPVGAGARPDHSISRSRQRLTIVDGCSAHAAFRNASRRSLKGGPVNCTLWPAPRMVARADFNSRWRTSQIASNTG